MQHSVHIAHMLPYSSGHSYYVDKLKNKKHEIFKQYHMEGLEVQK